MAVRPRQIAPVALVLALTAAGFVAALLLTERDARRDAARHAEVAAVQVRSRVEQAAALTESLRRFMLDAGGTGVTSDEFARNALRWLSPADFPAAAWVEQVPDSQRAAYERRLGRPIVTPDDLRSVVPGRSRSSYLPATLVSGFDPLAVPGTDLGGRPGMAMALTRATRVDGVAATPAAAPRSGPRGLFLVAPAANLVENVLRPGFVVLFAPDQTLRGSTDTPSVQVTAAGAPANGDEGAKTARRTFTAAGRRFDVVVPRETVQGAAAALPWLVLAAGLVLAALAGALGVNRARRARAQQELDQIFTLSSDLIVVANFDGCFTRVNPAVERILGYTEEELLARPYLDFVHPDDRERTVAEAARLSHGEATLRFENRYVRKDGSYSVLEWTGTPVPDEGLMYSVARDVTERRQAEAELERLADEQAALRRVATLVAAGVEPAELFTAVTEEVARLFLDVSPSLVPSVIRFDPGPEFVLVGATERLLELPIGSRWGPHDLYVSTRVLRTGGSARVEETEVESDRGHDAELLRRQGFRNQVGSPIVVEGRPWGAITMNSMEALPPDAGERLEKFTELVATAIANADSREGLKRLADEQAALRRVATLVAEGAPPTPVFDAVAAEMSGLLGAEHFVVSRYEPGTELTVMAHRGPSAQAVPRGGRIRHEGDGVEAVVRRTARSARLESDERARGVIAELAGVAGVRVAVGAPIVVEGRLWGVVSAGWSSEESPPPDTEQRMARFAQLLDTAIANADSREQLTTSRARLLTAADEARRRVVRDLHDGAQQRLVHTIVTLKLAQRALRGNDGDPQTLVGEALEHAQQGNVELRELAHGILPAALTRGGLRDAIDAVVARLDLPVHVDVPDERFPLEIEASAYFIVAEALTNVVKHAHATRADVRATVDDGMLRVEIRDDGSGGADPEGHGIVGMDDRATALGGRLEIDSPDGRGTLVVATLPRSDP